MSSSLAHVRPDDPSENPTLVPTLPSTLPHDDISATNASYPQDNFAVDEKKESFDEESGSENEAASVINRRAERRFLLKLDICRECTVLPLYHRALISKAFGEKRLRSSSLTHHALTQNHSFNAPVRALVLTWAWLAYMIKQIDTSNYKSVQTTTRIVKDFSYICVLSDKFIVGFSRYSYVAGQKEALNMNGNELNYMETTWRIGQ